MSFIIGFRRTLVTCSTVVTLLCTVVAHATMEPRFELDAQTLDASKPTLKLSQKNETQATRSRIDKPIDGSGSRETIYIVRQGDNLFKILMHKYGLTNDDAEAFIKEICRKNNIKTYLTMNTVIFDGEVKEMKRMVDSAKKNGITFVRIVKA